ncbi:hypothetical protein SISNIDRAFT_464104 [Sistotremastrum niveocremeum HHB9708]|uniref:Uncharacterized protein n=1 Tax=Sistotremastrum niveocremeum HHB9708 TaxID=1314777 RepID=A0A164XA13_9AGAM|nr:hypothetical protein SISNIDRAFT_464104 [Sistotremastrum niveocremeum HHB9708]
MPSASSSSSCSKVQSPPPAFPWKEVSFFIIQNGTAHLVPEFLTWIGSPFVPVSDRQSSLETIQQSLIRHASSSLQSLPQEAIKAYEHIMGVHGAHLRDTIVLDRDWQFRGPDLKAVSLKGEMVREMVTCISLSGKNAVRVFRSKYLPVLRRLTHGKRAIALLAAADSTIEWMGRIRQDSAGVSDLTDDLISMGLAHDTISKGQLFFGSSTSMSFLLSRCHEAGLKDPANRIVQAFLLESSVMQTAEGLLVFFLPAFQRLRDLKVPLAWGPIRYLWGYAVLHFTSEAFWEERLDTNDLPADFLPAPKLIKDTNRSLLRQFFILMPLEERMQALGPESERIEALMKGVWDEGSSGSVDTTVQSVNNSPGPTNPPPPPAQPRTARPAVTANPPPSSRPPPPTATTQATTRHVNPIGATPSSSKLTPTTNAGRTHPSKAESSRVATARVEAENQRGKRKRDDDEEEARTGGPSGESDKRTRITRVPTKDLRDKATAYLEKAGNGASTSVLGGSSRMNARQS